MTGEELKSLRLQMGLTQSALGERLGMTRRSISTWERRSALPPMVALSMVALSKNAVRTKVA